MCWLKLKHVIESCIVSLEKPVLPSRSWTSCVALRNWITWVWFGVRLSVCVCILVQFTFNLIAWRQDWQSIVSKPRSPWLLLSAFARWKALGSEKNAEKAFLCTAPCWKFVAMLALLPLKIWPSGWGIALGAPSFFFQKETSSGWWFQRTWK